MSVLSDTIEKLVTANRILAREEVVDGFGHVSHRHPTDPNHYLLSRSRSPELVEESDILEFTLDGTCLDDKGGMKPYLERFIHGAVYKARPDVQSVVHNHSYAVVPFSASKAKLRPIGHTGAVIGKTVPTWDIREKFGDKTDLLVRNMDHGDDLAKRLGKNRVVLMRGHGATATGISVSDAVCTAIYLQVSAKQALDAAHLGGDITYLSDGEIDAQLAPEILEVSATRIWEYLARRAGR